MSLLKWQALFEEAKKIFIQYVEDPGRQEHALKMYPPPCQDKPSDHMIELCSQSLPQLSEPETRKRIKMNIGAVQNTNGRSCRRLFFGLGQPGPPET